MDPASQNLLDAFAGAYRGYVSRRLAAAGLPDVPDAIEAGIAWLREALGGLLGRPFAAQDRSPLEVFQEALRFPTEALEAEGVPPVDRDPAAQSALPGDRYDLAPPSSQDLGDEAWRAHLAWGAAKAGAMTGPSVVVITRNLLDAARLDGAATTAGYRITVATGVPDGSQRHTIAFVDLEHPDADEAVRSLAESCGKVIAYGPHVDDLAMVRARALGAADAIPRSRFFSDPGRWLPPPV